MDNQINNVTTESAGENLGRAAVDTDIMFSNHKKVFKPGIAKHQRKLLAKIRPIEPFLEQGEKIVRITTACSPISMLEQMLTGWIVFYLKRCLLVFTDRRILHVPTTHNFSYRQSIAQILYGDCRSITVKNRMLVILYKNGTSEKFLYLAGKDHRKIKSMFKGAPLEGPSSDAAQRTHLCPQCKALLLQGRYTCPNCSLEFKNAKKGRKLSIIWPGGGYFYTRHPWLGIGDAFAETYLTVLFIIALVAALAGTAEATFACVLFAFVLALEKMVTIYHCRGFVKEFIPENRQSPTEIEQPKSPVSSNEAEKPKVDDVLSVR